MYLEFPNKEVVGDKNCNHDKRGGNRATWLGLEILSILPTDYLVQKVETYKLKVSFSKRANEDEEEEQTLYYPKSWNGELKSSSPEW